MRLRYVVLAAVFASMAPCQAVPVPAWLCDGVHDSRDALQAILTANAGKSIILPDGLTCLISPVADKTKFLTLPAGTILRGHATLKVAGGSAPYDSILHSQKCSGCQISELTIDSNINENPVESLADLMTHPRQEIQTWSGDDFTVRNIVIQNSSSVNSITANGKRLTVADSRFYAIGDDPKHVPHDHSTLYLTGTQILVAGNHFTGSSRGAPGAVTAIELHGSTMSVTGNTVVDYAAGINYTGVFSGESEAGAITGNVISGALHGIVLWSRRYMTHTSGHGINGLIVSGNSIRINQTDYSSPPVSGIVIDPGANLPVANIRIADNQIVFDLESSIRKGDSVSIGIGWFSANAMTAANLSIENNTIDNPPVAGIRLSTGGVTGLRITSNTIRNAGSSLDAATNGGYKIPIFIATTKGVTQGEISSNTIVDSLGASRMTKAFYLKGAAGANDLRVTGNSVALLGATTASWSGYFDLPDDNLKPLVHMTVAGKPWAPPSRAMRGGSQVLDTTRATQSDLKADGVAWTDGSKAPDR